jgi:hypothetical protein
MKEEENLEQKGECVLGWVGAVSWLLYRISPSLLFSLSSTAQRIAKTMSVSIVDNIKTCDELYWHKCTYRKGRKTASAPFPVRICNSDEAIGLALKQKWDSTKEELVQYLSHGGLNELSLVAKSQLTRGLVPQTDTWCPDSLHQYLAHLQAHKKKDALTVLLEKLYLEKIAQRIHEKEANAPEEEEEEVVSDDDDDQGPLIPETKLHPSKPRPVIASADGAPDNKNDKLRVGDVIEYTNTIMVAGDPRGHRVATILSVRPKQEYRLVLDNAELLPSDTLIRRIQRCLRNKLVPYNGKRRAIEDHKLQGSSESVSVADGFMQEVKRIDKIIKTNYETLLDRLEQDGIPARGRDVTEIAQATNATASDNARKEEESVNKSSGNAMAESANEEVNKASVSVGAPKAAAPTSAQGHGDESESESEHSAANVPKNLKDGLYQRPSGHARMGMDWDAVKGIWIPLSNPDSASIQAPANDASTKATASDNARDKEESILKGATKAPVHGQVPKIAPTDAARKHQGTKRKLSAEEQMPPPPSKRPAKDNSPTDKSASSSRKKKSAYIQSLEEQLNKFELARLNVGSNRSQRANVCNKTMTEEMFRLAIKVWQKIPDEYGSVQDACAFLEEQVDFSAYRIEKFLIGDPGNVLHSKRHGETEVALTEWLKK